MSPFYIRKLGSLHFKSRINFPRDIPDLSGQVMIVTGGNTGIGKETVKVSLRDISAVPISLIRAIGISRLFLSTMRKYTLLAEIWKESTKLLKSYSLRPENVPCRCIWTSQT